MGPFTHISMERGTSEFENNAHENMSEDDKWGDELKG